MSLGSALSASVSGLKAQSAAISAVSENIANASTTAYKNREITFESLVNSSGTSSLNAVGGGVTYTTSQAVSEQGLVENTGVSTNIAIQGEGFFVVADDATSLPSAYMYTRNGDFSTDEDGLLINNEGMILLAQRTDENGVVTATNSSDLNSLEPIDLNTISGTAAATSSVSMKMNIPADGDVYDPVSGTPVYVTALEVFDELGVSHTIEQTWYKQGPNEWVVDYADPYKTSDGSSSTATGAIDIGGGESAQYITFNGDGSIATIDATAFDATTYDPATFTAPATLTNADVVNTTITGLSATTGANDLSFTIDLGTSSLFDGLTQFASQTTTPDIEINTIEGDGVRFGQLSGVEINDEGLVTATFDNGVTRAIFQIAIATFPNPEGLTNVSGTVYDENENAGNLNLLSPGDGSAGTIAASSLELSSVDTSEEFNKMIVAQQAYSSAAQIVSTVDDMFETLISVVR